MATAELVQDAQKWHTSSFYREAVENVVGYNSQLLKDRRSRLPYLDTQTGIAQSPCNLLRSRLERRRGNLPGQIYSYPPYRWRLESKPIDILARKLPHLQAEQSATRGASPAAGLIQTVEGGVVTKRSSRIAGMSRKEDLPHTGMVVLPPTVRVALESPVSSELNEEEESPEADLDYLDEYDSEEERKLKKRRKVATQRKAVVSIKTAPKSDHDSKPFLCTVCGRRYKTSSSLKAHHTQYHGGETFQVPAAVATTSHHHHPPPHPPPPPPSTAPREDRVHVILPQPPNLVGKEDAKPSPYCDFCLGDHHTNRKNNKTEKMVSCANCGRSAHPSCMQFSTSLANVVRTYRWQCIECKSCHFCGTSENDDKLLFCDDCDRGYHMYCLKPPISTQPEGNWSCGMCFKTVIAAP